MDFFSDYFSADELILSLSRTQYVPGTLGADGLFATAQLAGTKFSHGEDPDDDVSESTALPRGAPGAPLTLERRKVYTWEITHGYPKRGTILADEVLNLRGGGMSAARELIASRRDRMISKFRRAADWQHEYLRVACLNSATNQIGNAPAAAAIGFGANDSAIRSAIHTNVVLPVEAALGGQPYMGLVAYCSNTFWVALIESKTIKETYLNQVAANELRNAPADAFDYGGVRWKRYRAGGNIAITDGQAKVVPLGVPDLLVQAFAPNDTVDSVGSGELGQPYYMTAEDLPRGKGVELCLDTYPLMVCTNPPAVITIDLS